MDERHLPDALDVAREVARKFKRRAWWAEVAELEAEILAELVGSYQSFNPEMVFRAWAWRVAFRAARNALWSASSPCTGPQRPTRAQTEALRGQQRQEVDEDAAPLTAAVPRQDELVASKRFRLALRRELARVIDGGRGGDLATEVLLFDDAPAEVAAREGVEVGKVYRAVCAAKRRIESDARLYQLWTMGRMDDNEDSE